MKKCTYFQHLCTWKVYISVHSRQYLCTYLQDFCTWIVSRNVHESVHESVHKNVREIPDENVHEFEQNVHRNWTEMYTSFVHRTGNWTNVYHKLTNERQMCIKTTKRQEFGNARTIRRLEVQFQHQSNTNINMEPSSALASTLWFRPGQCYQFTHFRWVNG